MRKKEKILVSVLALLFSICAAGVGFSLAGDSKLPGWGRFVCNFIFTMQFLFSLWVVMAVFRKTKGE
ncbi:MAG: hypothetical protein HFH02_04075 [Dorea sp.]|nr:hypothetical protein [Dorea sp.]